MYTKTAVVLLVLLIFGVTAWTQNYPKIEVALDYSLVHFVPAKEALNTHNLNGGGGQFTYNFTQYLGIKADFQGYGSQVQTFTVQTSAGPISLKANGNLFTYLFGPQIKYHGKFAPFGEILFGAAHSNVYNNLVKGSPTGAFITSRNPSNNGFAMAVGGGIDIKVHRIIAVRPAEINYLLTRFGNPITNNNANQNNFRYCAGVVLQFGGL